jgi:hypothetical protein
MNLLRHPFRRRFSAPLHQRRPVPPPRRLVLELVEDRTLLSATLVLDGPQTLVPLASVNVSQDTSVDLSEMTVTVNPANPLNLAGFSHYIKPTKNYDQIGVYYSMDGGATWSLTLIGGTGSVNSDGFGSSSSDVRFDPTIKFDDEGNLFVGYGAYTGTTTKLMVAKSIDGGASFANSAFKLIEADSGYGGVDKWYLATGPAGPSGGEAVYIAYDRPDSGNTVFVAGSNDGGDTFTGPVTVDASTTSNLFAGPAVGPNGELYVAWESIADGKIKIRAKPDGLWGSGGWNPVTTVRTLRHALYSFAVPPESRRGIEANPSIDVDRSGDAYTGRVYVAYTDLISGTNTDIYLTYSGDGGATWSDPGTTGNVENAPASAFHSWVSVDQSSGSVNVLYKTNDDGDPDNYTSVTRVASSFDGGVTFSSKANLSDQESRALSASYNEDFLDYTGFDARDGTVHGFWSDNRGSSPGTYSSSLAIFSAMAGFQSQTGTNTLYVSGDDYGPTDDAILVSQSPVNPDFLQVQVNGQIQYAGLMLSVNNIVVDGGEGNNTIVVQGSFPGISITLTAGSGRNLFITGVTPSTILGGGDNILIGGSTQWDNDPTALAAIMAEWTRTDETYDQRVANLLNGGGLNGSYVLNNSTVTGNGGGNVLLGGSGLNLYFGNPDLDVNDWDPNTETFVSV